MSMFDHYVAMDAALVAAGFPPTSPWWLAFIRRFYESGRKQAVVRAGRRSGKSTTLARVAVCEAIAGDHAVTPGDLGICAFVSVSRDEAAKRLRLVETILRALNVAFRPLRDGHGIELADQPRGFQVFAASIAGVSGPTIIFAVLDEVAKMRDADSGANPASQVIASIKPAMATMPNAKIVLSSSPMATVDAHAEAYEQGETDFQITAYGETWTCNPTLTEADCRALEPDQKIFDREYRAIPAASASTAFDPAVIEPAFIKRNPTWPMVTKALVIDPSSLRRDEFAYGVVGWCIQPDHERYVQLAGGGWWYLNDGSRLEREDYVAQKPFIRMLRVGGIAGGSTMSAEDVVNQLAIVCQSHDIKVVIADQRDEFTLSSMFATKRLKYIAIDWTNASKGTAVERLRRWFTEQMIQLPDDQSLRDQLKKFEEKYTPSGNITYAARGSGHDDRVALLLTTAMAEIQGHLPRARQETLDQRGYRIAKMAGYA